MPDPPPVSLRWGDAEPRHEPLVRRSNPVIMESIPNLSTGPEARGRVSQGREGLTPYVLQGNEGLGIKTASSRIALSVLACEPGSVQRCSTCGVGYLTESHHCRGFSYVDFYYEMWLSEYRSLFYYVVVRGQGTSRADFFDLVFRKSRGFLYGGMYNEVFPSEEKTQKKSERQNGWLANLDRPKDKEKVTRQKFFANLGSLENLKDFMVNTKRVLHFITSSESTSASVEFSNLSVSEEFRLSILKAMSSQNWEKVESLIMPIAVALPGSAAVYRAVVILAAFFLSVVYQYLIGLLHRGGANVHSSGSLEFRSTYISIVLFQGAYVWIKSRDAAPPSSEKTPPGLHRIYKKTKLGERIPTDMYEPRFKPHGSKGGYISVGSFKLQDAMTMYQIVAFLYGKGEGELRYLGGINTYHIPPMTAEDRQRLFDPKQKTWVSDKAKDIYKDYKIWVGVEDMLMGYLQVPDIQPPGNFGNTVPPLPDCADASAGSGQMDTGRVQANRGDGLVSVPSGHCSPDVDPVTQGMQHIMANDTLGNDEVCGADHLTVPESSMRSLPETATNIPANGAAVPCGQPWELQLQHGSLQENQANNSAINIIPDDRSQVQRQVIELQREVKELQRQKKESERQQQRDQLLIRQQQSQISESESRISESERQQQRDQLQIRQQQSQISELERQQQRDQLQIRQQQSQISQSDSRISELEVEVESFRSTEHVRKRSRSGHTLRHDLQN